MGYKNCFFPLNYATVMIFLLVKLPIWPKNILVKTVMQFPVSGFKYAETIFPATCNTIMTNEKHWKL